MATSIPADDTRNLDGGNDAQDEVGEEGRSRRKVWTTRLTVVAALALTAYLLHRTLSNYSVDEIIEALSALPVSHLGLAGLFAAASYACLTLFDYLAIRYVGRPIPYPQVALTSFISLSIGHSVGFAGLSSGAIRYRYYKRFGLSVGDVARVILFTGLTVGVGLTGLAGLALLLQPDLAQDLTGLPSAVMLAAGAGCIAAVGAYVGAAALLRRPIRIRRFRMEIPPLRLALAQVVVGVVNFSLVAACLHQCIAGVADVPYLSIVTVYVSANVATLVTHVPGGLGVIEAVTLALVSAPMVIGSVLAFRAIYFLTPLAIGTATFLVTEAVLKASTRQTLGGR